jgi:hypothetical protein
MLEVRRRARNGTGQERTGQDMRNKQSEEFFERILEDVVEGLVEFPSTGKHIGKLPCRCYAIVDLEEERFERLLPDPQVYGDQCRALQSPRSLAVHILFREYEEIRDALTEEYAAMVARSIEENLVTYWRVR